MNDIISRIRVSDISNIINYQLDILRIAQNSALLNPYIGIDNEGVYITADIDELKCLKDYTAYRALTRNEILSILKQALDLSLWCIRHLLHPACLNLDPSLIFLLPCYEDCNSFEFEDPKFEDTLGINNIKAKFMYIPMSTFIKKSDCVTFGDKLIEFISIGVYESLFTECELQIISGLNLLDSDNSLARIYSLIQNSGNTDSGGKAVIQSDSHSFIKNKLKAIIPKSLWSSVPVLLFIAALIQAFLIYIAYVVLKFNYLFSNTAYPIIIICVILIILGISDAILFFNKTSPLNISVLLPKSKDDIDNNNLFSIKEEKTTNLSSVGSNSRIAMICTGIPGTAEEMTGQKAYILIDDFLIGREKVKVDFRIESLSVGRVHARISRKQNSFFIEDLGSRNGTFIDQKRLKKFVEYPLPDKCKIKFADKEFFFTAS